ncbi:MAG: hypothetical protein M3169_12270 [Candidatus Eremiobacteraeota bacterium]|nr:hypothetical protein [Candidatus Eremiobacteraeota bacterium]
MEASIDPDVQGEDRDVMRRAAAALPPTSRRRLSRKSLFVVWLIGKTGTMKAYSNHGRMKRNAVALAPNPGTVNMYTDHGRVFAVPGMDPPHAGAASNGRAPQYVVVQPNHRTGPYRRIIAPAGYNYQAADIALACNQSITPGDTGYVYMGGRGDNTPNSQTEGVPVEAGLQYGQVSGTYAPYIKISGEKTTTGGDFFYIQDANVQTADTSPSGTGRWSCSSSTETNLHVTFGASFYTDGTGTTYPAWSIGTYEKADDNVNIQFEVAATDKPYPYGGWSAACDGCVMIRTTSIAQAADNFGDGSYYGFINWSNAILSSYTSTGAGVPWPSGSECEDYPAWSTTPQQECSSGPPPAAASTSITVNYTDLNNENVSIDLTPNGISGAARSRNPH